MFHTYLRGRTLVTDSTVIREIFGPVLPIIAVEDVDEAIEFINARYVCPLGSLDPLS